MTLACDEIAPFFSAHEKLALTRIGDAKHKSRLAIYIALNLVRVNTDISERTLRYRMHTLYGYSDETCTAVISSLSTFNMFPLLRWWRNNRMRRASERFFSLNSDRMEDLDTYIEYLESAYPEFKQLTFAKKGIQ